MKPVIGITGNCLSEEHCFSFKDYYVDAVTRAGGLAILLPATTDEMLQGEYLSICQGLLLSGGGDLDPCYWGEQPQPLSGEIDPLRDSFELRLASKVKLNHKAVLGICRGCQVLNTAAGGSLIQDIRSHLHHMQKAPRAYPIHDIFIENNSQLGGIMGTQDIRVNSFHHQAIRKPGEGLFVTAMASDGTVEAIESRSHPFYLGVQWHPECMTDDYSARLFAAFIAAARI